MAEASPSDRRGLSNRYLPPADVGKGAAQGRTNETRGRTNGLVNGMGRTNGVVNGLGKTNGLVNGIGYTNGVRLRRSTFGIVGSSDYRRTAVFIAVSIAVMLMLSLFLGTQEPVPSPFAVDGDFSEWAGVPKYDDGVDALPAHADLVAFAVVQEPGRLFAYGRTRGPMFPGNETSSVYVLIDDPASTGYAVQGRDVDFLAEAWGWNGRIRESAFREWVGDPDRDNATSLRTRGSFDAASSGTEFELVLNEGLIDLDPARGLRMSLATRFDDAVDVGVAVLGTPGALTVDATPLTDLVGSTAMVLELRFRAHLANVDVRSMSFDQTGGGSRIVPNPRFTVAAGQERIERIALDPTGVTPGSLVTLRLRSVDAVLLGSSDAVPATLAGPAARVYVQAAPAGYVVDGLFSEWTAPTADPDDLVPSSVDLLESAFSVPTDAFFYVRTEGDALAGALLPERRMLSPPPSANVTASGPVPLKRNAAEDVLQIFVDSDDRDTVGFTVAGIQADRLVEVRGRNGRVTSSGLFVWNDVTWNWDPRGGTVDVALVLGELEASAPASFFGTLNNPRVVFAMTDWASRTDLTDQQTRSFAPSLRVGGPTPLHALPPDEITATLLVNTPTIDGRCDSFGGEYSGASVDINLELRFAVGRRDDTQFLFVCIQVDADTTANNNDWGEVIFDTLHDGGLAPQVDDKLFWVWGNGAFPGLRRWQGNGVGWSTSCPTCDAGDAGASQFRGGIENYEFRIRYTDVWATLAPAPGQIAGFAIIACDRDPCGAVDLFEWGGPSVLENVPDSWGHLYYDIPEFPVLILSVVPMVLIPVIRRRRSESAEQAHHFPDFALEE